MLRELVFHLKRQERENHVRVEGTANHAVLEENNFNSDNAFLIYIMAVMYVEAERTESSARNVLVMNFVISRAWLLLILIDYIFLFKSNSPRNDLWNEENASDFLLSLPCKKLRHMIPQSRTEKLAASQVQMRESKWQKWTSQPARASTLYEIWKRKRDEWLSSH